MGLNQVRRLGLSNAIITNNLDIIEEHIKDHLFLEKRRQEKQL